MSKKRLHTISSLFGFELKKLISNRLFMMLIFLILCCDMLYMRSYTENRYELYEKIAEQDGYADEYALFINEMSDRANKMNNVGILSQTDTFSSRNIIKTTQDYANLGHIAILGGNNLTLTAIADYNPGIVFLLAVVAITVYYLMFTERNKNLFRLIKTTKNGRFPFAISKLMTCIFIGVKYVFLETILTYLLQSIAFGFNDINRSIQSVSSFRNCIYAISIYDALVIALLIRAGVAVFFSVLFYMAGIFAYSEIGALALSTCITSMFYIFFSKIENASKLIFLKCANPFYMWDMRLSIGEYININVMGYPVSKEVLQVIFFLIFAISAAGIGIWGFCSKDQSKRESLTEKVCVVLREKTERFSHHSSLFYYEVYKTLICQKKIIVLAGMIVLFINSAYNSLEDDRYRTFKEAAYHMYMDNLEGKITSEKLEFLYNEKMRIDEGIEIIGRASSYEEMTEFEDYDYINLCKDGFKEVERQYNRLNSEDGNLLTRFFVDEMSYASLWGNPRKNIQRMVICLLGCILLISGMYPYDFTKDMQQIIKTTVNGQRKIVADRFSLSLIWVFNCYIMYDIPNFIKLYKIDHLSCIGARFIDFTGMNCKDSISLGTMLILIMVLRFAVFLIVGLAEYMLSKIILKENISVILCGGAVILIGLLLYFLSMDFSLIMLKLLQI